MSDETEIPNPPPEKKKRKAKRAWTPEQRAAAAARAKARIAKAPAAEPASFAATFAQDLTLSAGVEAMLRGKAREAILEEKRAKLEALRYDELLEEERAKYEPQEELAKFMIVTPGVVPSVERDVTVMHIPTVNIIDPLGVQVGVRINNKLFVTDRIYEEKRSLFAMIAHSCFCAMKIERAVGNPNRDYNVQTKIDIRQGTPVVNRRSSILGV